MQAQFGATRYYSPEMLELREILSAYFKDLIEVVDGNSVNGYSVHMSIDSFPALTKKLNIHGHKIHDTAAEHLKTLQLKTGASFHMVVSQEFFVLVTT